MTIKIDYKHKYKLLLQDWNDLGRNYKKLETRFNDVLKDKNYNKIFSILNKKILDLNKKILDLKKNQELVISSINLIGDKIDKLAGEKLK